MQPPQPSPWISLCPEEGGRALETAFVAKHVRDGQGQSIYSPLILRVWPNLKKYHFLNYELINLVFFSSYCFYYYLLLLLLLLLGGVPFGNGNENIFALNFI